MKDSLTRIRVFTLYVIFLLMVYFLAYAGLRLSHVMVHFENVLIPGGNAVESGNIMLDAVFYPTREMETFLHRLGF